MAHGSDWYRNLSDISRYVGRGLERGLEQGYEERRSSRREEERARRQQQEEIERQRRNLESRYGPGGDAEILGPGGVGEYEYTERLKRRQADLEAGQEAEALMGLLYPRGVPAEGESEEELGLPPGAEFKKLSPATRRALATRAYGEQQTIRKERRGKIRKREEELGEVTRKAAEAEQKQLEEFGFEGFEALQQGLGTKRLEARFAAEEAEKLAERKLARRPEEIEAEERAKADVGRKLALEPVSEEEFTSGAPIIKQYAPNVNLKPGMPRGIFDQLLKKATGELGGTEKKLTIPDFEIAAADRQVRGARAGQGPPTPQEQAQIGQVIQRKREAVKRGFVIDMMKERAKIAASLPPRMTAAEQNKLDELSDSVVMLDEIERLYNTNPTTGKKEEGYGARWVGPYEGAWRGYYRSKGVPGLGGLTDAEGSLRQLTSQFSAEKIHRLYAGNLTAPELARAMTFIPDVSMGDAQYKIAVRETKKYLKLSLSRKQKRTQQDARRREMEQITIGGLTGVLEEVEE